MFIIKYLRTLGFDADNALFYLHSKYFRDALVRANYQNLKANVFKSSIYLDKFFDNLLLGGNHVLNSEDLKIGKITDIESKITDKFTDILSKPELKFLKMIETYLQTEEFIDNAQAQILSGKSAESVKKYFAKLVKVGALIAVGENKGRKYRLDK